MVSSTNLYLLRHAEVEARYQHVFGGRIDMELSPRGHEQAAILAKHLDSKLIHALYASLTRVELLPHKNQLQLLNFTPWRDLP